MVKPGQRAIVANIRNNCSLTRIIYSDHNRPSFGNFVFTLHKAVRINPGPDMLQSYVPLQGAEKGNSPANEDRDARDIDVLNETRSQETLNRFSAVDVKAFHSFPRQDTYYFFGGP